MQPSFHQPQPDDETDPMGSFVFQTVPHILVQAGAAASLGELLKSRFAPGRVCIVTDAHIAAIAIEHGAEVLSFDKDFAKFTGLRYKILS